MGPWRPYWAWDIRTNLPYAQCVITGGMMGVKQVELPTKVNDMEDPHQISMLETPDVISPKYRAVRWYPGDQEVS